LQTFLNGTHIPELDAVHLPYDYTVVGGQTVKEAVDGVVLGTIPDNTITTAKLIDGAVTFAKGGHGGATAAGGVYNLINALSATTPVSNDKFPFVDTSESTSGFVTLANLLTALYGVGALQFAVGTYSGTDVYGSDHPNSISFDFLPQVVIIHRLTGSANPYSDFLLFSHNATSMTLAGVSGSGTVHYSWSGNDLTWYSEDGVYFQFNTGGFEYFSIG